MNQPPQRVAAVAAPDAYVLPTRLSDADARVLDAYRQTQFVLGPDLDLFAEAMSLQVRLIKEARPPQYRTPSQAGIAALWSRAFFCLSDGLVLVTRGSYPSALPLVRAACELIAAQEGLRGGEIEEHNAWLAGALRPDEAHKAVDVGLGRYFSGASIAKDDVLRGVYRPVSDLARPNFGASMLQVGPESNQRLVSISFGDPSFHLGWAELILGWLLALAARQIRLVIDAEGVFFPIAEDAHAGYGSLQARVDAALARSDRCRVEEIEEGNLRRYLVHNFRRGSGASPKRFLL